jgi:hypothetical protein
MLIDDRQFKEAIEVFCEPVAAKHILQMLNECKIKEEEQSLDKLKEEIEEKFTIDATEVTACPKRRLFGKPEDLLIWVKTKLEEVKKQGFNDAIESIKTFKSKRYWYVNTETEGYICDCIIEHLELEKDLLKPS